MRRVSVITTTHLKNKSFLFQLRHRRRCCLGSSLSDWIPITCDGFGVGVKLDGLFSIESTTSDKAATRSGPAQERKRNGNRKVDSNLTHIHLMLKLASRSSARSEDGSTF